MSDTVSALERRLGPLDAAAIVVSNVIGVGIFTTPAIVATLAPSPGALIAVWIVGGLLALAGAMAYAELAALRPRAGGEYVYLREAFGPVAAFLTGWTSFVAGFSGAVAASAVGLAAYLGRFVPLLGDATPIAAVRLWLVTLSISPRSIVAITAIAVLTLVHIRGLGPGRVVQNSLAAIKIAALVVFVVAGFIAGQGSVSHFSEGESVAASGWLLAFIPVMFSYSGWNAAAYVAEEVRDPQRNVPWALALGTGAVVVLYLAVNALYIFAFTLQEMRTAGIRLGDLAAEQLLGASAGSILAAVSVVIMTGSISAMVLAGPRVYFAMARDGVFFSAAARVHPTFRTPWVAIAAQGLWSSLLVVSGTFDQLLTYTGIAVVLFAAIAVLSLFVLRARDRTAARPFSAWGYPWAPALFVLAGAAIVVNAILERPRTTAAGLLIMAAGLPLYYLMRRRKAS